MQIKLFLLLLLCMLSALFCTREYIENRQPVCFETEILPVFQSNCTQSGCHNSIDQEEGYDFSTYESIISKGIKPGDYKNSKVYQAISQPFGEIMPPKPYDRLSDEQLTSIALWIEQGARKTSCANTSCDTLAVTYSQSVKPIIQTYCGGCHSGSSPQGGIDYNNYTGVKTTVNSGRLIGSVQHQSGFSAMPKNGNKLSDCNIKTLKAWINAGALNN